MVAPIAVEALVTLPQNPFDQFLCWWLCRWGCGRRRAFPRFSSLLGKRGKRSRSAKPIVHIPTGLAVTEICKCLHDDPRGTRHWRGRLRRKLVFGRSGWIGTMMQSYASAARLRGGGSILLRGAKAMSVIGAPPPRSVICSPVLIENDRRTLYCLFPRRAVTPLVRRPLAALRRLSPGATGR